MALSQPKLPVRKPHEAHLGRLQTVRIFSQNQPSDFLGAAVQCGRWQLAGDLISHMGVGDLLLFCK